MKKILFTAFISIFCFAALAQDASSGDVVSALLAFVTTLLQGKPTPAVIGLGISQIVLLIIKAGWLDKQIGKVKMIAVSGIAILIPALTMYVASPSSSIAMILADATVMGAIQVFAHQILQHFVGKKALV